jgi:hypothetical protein
MRRRARSRPPESWSRARSAGTPEPVVCGKFIGGSPSTRSGARSGRSTSRWARAHPTSTRPPSSCRRLERPARAERPIASAAFFEHALRLAGSSRPDRRGWEIELAQACFEAGDLGRASEVLEALVDRLPEGNERADALWRLAVFTCERVEPAAWLRTAERALLEVRGDVALEAGILSELSWAALFVNDLEHHVPVAIAGGLRRAEPLETPRPAASSYS